MTKRAQKITAFAAGIGFIAVLIIIALAFPHPSPFQYLVFRITLALGAAGVAAMIPGFIEVQIGAWLRAGGALAVFAIVYFYNPARLVTEQNERTIPQSINNSPNSINIIGQAGGSNLLVINPAPKPLAENQPHFTFALQVGDSLDDNVQLTNDFLAVTNFGPIGHSEGELVIPVHEGQSNLTLTIWPTVDADVFEPLVMISLPRTWTLTPNSGWEWLINESVVVENGVTNIPNKLAFVLPQRVLLAGNGRNLPPLSITSFPQPSMTNAQGNITIMARGKSPTPTSCVACPVILFPVPTNIASRPFIKRGYKDSSGAIQFVISKSDFRELKH